MTEAQMQPGDTVYLTNSALSNGITEHVFKTHTKSGKHAAVVGVLGWLRADKEIHATREAAIAAAKAIRDRKVASLRKQIERLEAIDFA
jgi:hypothetical protein